MTESEWGEDPGEQIKQAIQWRRERETDKARVLTGMVPRLQLGCLWEGGLSRGAYASQEAPPPSLGTSHTIRTVLMVQVGSSRSPRRTSRALQCCSRIEIEASSRGVLPYEGRPG